MTPEPIIELQGVYRSFKSGRTVVPVLQDINFAVNKLEFLCLVGESGCGKTTTGKIICGLLPPSDGAILFEGQDIASLRGAEKRRHRRSVQIIHQDPYASLNPTQTVSEMLSYPLLAHGLTKGRGGANQRVRELLDLVDLSPVEDFIDKYPHQLSGGQRQRVSIARALTTEPSVIVADESVSMVDVSIRIGLLQMMMDLRDRLDVTIVFITHDLALAKYFAWDGRIGVMYLGRLVEIGATQQVISAPQHPYTKVLLSAIPEPEPGENPQQAAHPTAQRGHPALDRAAAGLFLSSALPLVCAGRMRFGNAASGETAQRAGKLRSRLHPAGARRRTGLA